MPEPHPATQNEHLRRLLEGNARFVAGTPIAAVTAERRAELAQGQAPFATILGCSDSRVPIEIVFDCAPGDVFAIRVAGNVVTDEVLGSIEYAVLELNSPLVMVLGHSSCGGVKAGIVMTEGHTFPGHIECLAEATTPAAEATASQSGDRIANAVAANVRAALAALTARSPILDAAAKRGAIALASAVYDLRSGIVTPLL